MVDTINLKWGWKKDKFDAKDYYHITAKIEEIPPVINLKSYLPKVRNQGQQGSCTGFGIGSNITATYAQQDANLEWESPQWIYNLGRFKGGTLNQDVGAWPKDCLDMLIEFGLLKEHFWPYDGTKLDISAPNDERKNQANKFLDFAYYRCVDSVNGILSALSEGHLVSIGSPWFQKWMQISSDGILPEVTETDSIVGGHETCLFGFSQEEQMLYGMNSWGEEWGDKGFYKMPFSTIDTFKKLWGYDAHYVTFTAPKIEPIPMPDPVTPIPPEPTPTPNPIPEPIPNPTPQPIQCCASTRAGIRAFNRTRKYLKNKSIREDEMKINWSSMFNQKFLLALGAIVADIIIGLGYHIDPQNIIIIAGAIASIYAAIQGLLESVKINANAKIQIAMASIALERARLNLK